MNFLKDVIASRRELIVREVKIGDQVGKVHFRRLTAGERHSLLKGQKVARQGRVTTFELDLAMNEEQQQKFVLFSVCNEDGTPFFKSIEEVRATDGAAVQALYRAASSIDGDDEEEAGKD